MLAGADGASDGGAAPLYPAVLPLLWAEAPPIASGAPPVQALPSLALTSHLLLHASGLLLAAADPCLLESMLWLGGATEEPSSFTLPPPLAALGPAARTKSRGPAYDSAAAAEEAARVTARRAGRHGAKHSRGVASVAAFGRPSISSSLEAAMCRDDRALAARAAAKEAGLRGMASSRARLPVAAYRQLVLDTVAANQVVLLSGDTGCGKTTQVPNFILEDAGARGTGGHVRIIVTQPRRIAAIGVATRVAVERGESLGSVESSVGYAIRGEKKAHAGTGLLFVTTGVLLRRLTGGLGHVTHIVVDEVHERNVDTDFLLAVLKRVLPHRPDVKLILMSATMNAAAFSAYFGAVPSVGSVACLPAAARPGGRGYAGTEPGAVTLSKGGVPVITVPGFMHPVREVYLEGILALTGYTPRVKGLAGGAGRSSTTVSATSAAAHLHATENEGAGRGRPVDEEELEEEDGEEPSTPTGKAGEPPAPSEITPALWRRHGLDYGLLAALVGAVATGGSARRGGTPASPSRLPSDNDGAILVFLPGVGEIRKLHRELQRVCGGLNLHVLHLHGSLTGEEQGLVFSRPPPGKRKVVLATNVAETSITIDDVTVVIDSLRVKESTYDALNRTSRLTEVWVSQAAAKQRRGRAGRVRPGMVYRLEPGAMHATLAAASIPEIQRTPLESLCLQVKLLGLGNIRDFMRSVLDRPPEAQLRTALSALLEIGALSPLEGGGGGTRTGSLPHWGTTSPRCRWTCASARRSFSGRCCGAWTPSSPSRRRSRNGPPCAPSPTRWTRMRKRRLRACGSSSRGVTRTTSRWFVRSTCGGPKKAPGRAANFVTPPGCRTRACATLRTCAQSTRACSRTSVF